VKHQHRGIARVSGGAILDLPPLPRIDRRGNGNLSKLGQVLRKEFGIV
jgi:hypothetical protein